MHVRMLTEAFNKWEMNLTILIFYADTVKNNSKIHL